MRTARLAGSGEENSPRGSMLASGTIGFAVSLWAWAQAMSRRDVAPVLADGGV